ncbi:MAG: hypothetical protein IIA17_10745 [candidate division Zixibacteria bacterium]|nr:hypothetical protein [candidate division Zixibacteria bacterium]
MNDAIVSGYLFELQSQKKAQKAPQENDKKGKETGWRLTQKEFERRRDDI